MNGLPQKSAGPHLEAVTGVQAVSPLTLEAITRGVASEGHP